MVGRRRERTAYPRRATAELGAKPATQSQSHDTCHTLLNFSATLPRHSRLLLRPASCKSQKRLKDVSFNASIKNKVFRILVPGNRQAHICVDLTH